MDITFDIGELAKFFLLINVLIAFKIYQRKKELKWFEFNLIWAFCLQVYASKHAEMYGNNLPLLHLHTWVEFILLSFFYREILFKNLKIRRFFYPFIAIVTALLLYNSLYIEPITIFNSNAKGLTQTIIIAYAISYFFNRISIEVSKRNLVINRLNAAILLYYAGSLFIFIFANFLVKNSEKINSHFWNFNAFLYLVFQILILVATWRLVVSPSDKPTT